jgi:peptidoglycan hydrolase CwlO-like protein
MRRLSHIFLVFLLCLVSLGTPYNRALAVTEDELSVKKQEIAELQKKIDELQSQKQSLAQTINYLSTKILLTEKEIDKTEAEITLLSDQIKVLEGKIGVLNVNLEKLTQVMVNRVATSYKKSATQPVLLLLVADGFNDFFRKYKYLKVSQQHDREVIFALEEAKANYDAQKQVKEQKQAEVVTLQEKLLGQKNALAKQQKDKQTALLVTRNDELRYQDQLARALAEIRAIQSIIAGGGEESAVGPVKEGDNIASVIVGASACSSGSHLHFEVVKDKTTQNPANYLASNSIVWDNGPDGPFGFSGSWRWPVNNPVRITQGYGMTFYATTLRYYGGNPHTGLDMISDSGNYGVSAVKGGTLYRGAIGCGKGTLRYVHVEQADGVSAYYLHVNY